MSLKDKVRIHEVFIKDDVRYFSENDVKEAVLEFKKVLSKGCMDFKWTDEKFEEIFGDFEE